VRGRAPTAHRVVWCVRVRFKGGAGVRAEEENAGRALVLPTAREPIHIRPR
jgi:hypothetical protein